MGCSTGVGKYLLPRVIKDFRTLYPQVRFDVTVCTHNSISDLLTNGEVNMVLCSNSIKHVDLEVMPIYNDTVSLIVHPEHRWAELGRISPSELIDEPMIGREDTSGTKHILNDALVKYDIHPDMLNIVMTLTNVEAITLAVENNLGVAFVSRLVAARSVAAGKLAFVEVEGVELKQTINLVRNHRLPITLSQNTLWDYVQQVQPNMINNVAEMVDVRDIVLEDNIYSTSR
jgi:DNA-binding transcriptional LysR family regulator